MEKNLINQSGQFKIYIDDKEYFSGQSVISGNDLRSLAGLDSSEELWHIIPGRDNDKFIETFDSVNLEMGMRFFSGKKSISPGK